MIFTGLRSDVPGAAAAVDVAGDAVAQRGAVERAARIDGGRRAGRRDARRRHAGGARSTARRACSCRPATPARSPPPSRGCWTTASWRAGSAGRRGASSASGSRSSGWCSATEDLYTELLARKQQRAVRWRHGLASELSRSSARRRRSGAADCTTRGRDRLRGVRSRSSPSGTTPSRARSVPHPFLRHEWCAPGGTAFGAGRTAAHRRSFATADRIVGDRAADARDRSRCTACRCDGCDLLHNDHTPRADCIVAGRHPSGVSGDLERAAGRRAATGMSCSSASCRTTRRRCAAIAGAGAARTAADRNVARQTTRRI